MRRFHLDWPEVGVRLNNGDLIQGWAAGSDPEEGLVLTLNGSSISFTPVDRPDVVEAYPDLHSSGFALFFEPSDETECYQLSIRLGDQAQDHLLLASSDAKAEADGERAARACNRQIIADRLACAVCHTSQDLLGIVGRRWRCRSCDTQFNCETSLNLIPSTYENFDAISFNGAICRHGYDAFVEELLAEVEADGGVVLDCGAGLRPRVRPGVITTEILPYPTTDVIAVGEHLPFVDQAFDAVICLHVLEHVKNPFVVTAELMRVLKAGGRFIAVTPYICPVHGFPFHFFNPTPEGLRSLFAPFAQNIELTVPPAGHPLAGLSVLVHEVINYMNPENRERLSMLSLGELAEMSIEDLIRSGLYEKFDVAGLAATAGNYLIKGRRT